MIFYIIMFICLYCFFKTILNAIDNSKKSPSQLEEEEKYATAIQDLTCRLQEVLKHVEKSSDVDTEPYKPLIELVNELRKHAKPKRNELKDKTARQLFYENFGELLEKVSHLKGWSNHPLSD